MVCDPILAPIYGGGSNYRSQKVGDEALDLKMGEIQFIWDIALGLKMGRSNYWS